MSKKVKKIKKIEINQLNEAYQKILYWFFSFPNIETNLNELSKNLSIAKTTANKIVIILEKEGFLIKKVYGKTWSIRCNQFHYFNRTKKIAFNLDMVSELYENELKKIIYELIPNPQSIILFGSYRKGDDNEQSDIDIAVEVLDEQEIRIIEAAIVLKFGFRQNVSVNFHIFSKNKVDINLFSNITNGIILDGFLEVKPWELKDPIKRMLLV